MRFSQRRERLSSCVFRAVWVIATMLLIVPGRAVLTVDIVSIGQYGPPFSLAEYYEHGWPLTFMRRSPVLDGVADASLLGWKLFDGVESCNLWLLIFDVTMCLGAYSLCKIALKMHRRNGYRVLQFRLGGLTLFIASVAVCIAVVVFQRSEYRNDWKALQSIEAIEHRRGESYVGIRQRAIWHSGCRTWIRDLVGDRVSYMFDRIVSIDVSQEELNHISRLSGLRVVRLISTVSPRQLQVLEELPHLEALDMSLVDINYSESGSLINASIRLPTLPKLRGLNLHGSAFCGDGLENIPSIETLDLTDTDIDDNCVPALSKLTKLRRLSVRSTDLSLVGINRIRRALPNCNIEL